MNFLHSLGIARPIPEPGSETIFMWGHFPVTNTFLLITFIFVLCIVFAAVFVRKFKVVPSRLQGMVEYFYESLASLSLSITGVEKRSKEIFPVMASLIVYITIANLIGLVPGLTSILFHGTPIFRSPMSDFNTTFGLAFAMVLMLQLVTIREWGFLGYLGRFFQFKKLYQGARGGFSEFFVAVIEFLVGIMDILSEIAKVVSLSFRLFGNVFAGEVILTLLVGAVAYVVPSLWMALSILFGVIQAIVFGALVGAYYTGAIKEENEFEATA